MDCLGTASDWQLQADLKSRMQFPPQIVANNRRPDIAVWSLSSRQAIMVELTVPWEERIEEAYDRAEEEEVPESGYRLSTAWLEGMVPSCRGGMPRIRGAIYVEGNTGHWGHWCR